MSHSNLERDTPSRRRQESGRQRRIRGVLSRGQLRRQNIAYAGSGGVSKNNRAAGFVPGFLDTRSGKAVASRFANGAPAPVHVLDGLPDTWVLQRDAQGRAIRVHRSVIAGFLLGERFYTREQAACMCAA